MDVRVLRYVEAIARHGSFTRAATELNIAQPALSIAIKKLEEELRVGLFVRQARKVVATPEGLVLLRRAERIFQEIGAARREMEAAADLKSGEIKIGLPPMYGLAYFPDLVISFKQKYPGIMLTAIIGSASDIRRQIDEGAIDFGLLESRRVPSIWKRVEVGRDETTLCVPKSHPLAKKKKISGRDLDRLPMVVFDHTFFQRTILDNRCKSANAQPVFVLQSNFVPLIVRAVRDGLGAATLLRSLVAHDTAISCISFDPVEIFRFCLCWRDDSLLSQASRAFIHHASQRYDAKIGNTAKASQAKPRSGQARPR